MSTTIISADAAWERSALRQTRDDTALRITIRGHNPVKAVRAPIDIALVLDRSGSMGGDKIQLAKKAVTAAIDLLEPGDRVALVSFDHEVDVVQPLATATSHTRAEIRRNLEPVTARGSTALADGWLTGCQQLAAAIPPAGVRLQRAILLTDGQANIGITDIGELSTHASQLWARGISTTALGIGTGFDEILLSSMTEAGGGNFQYIEHPSQLAAFFAREIGGLTELAALHPRLEITLPRGLRAHLLNRFPQRREGKTITVDLRDLIDGDEIDLVFTVTHRGNLDASSSHVRATLTATDPARHEPVSLTVDIPALSFVSDTEAERAPVDHAVAILRASEQAICEQREALRLDREGRFAESRALFAQSRDRLADADAMAAVTGYAGIDHDRVHRIQSDLADSRNLAAAPATALGEDVHKSRTARHTHHSRGGRRDQDQQ